MPLPRLCSSSPLYVIAILLFSFIFSHTVFVFTIRAQDLDDATVSGRVVDGNNAAIAGATVTVTRQATGAERTLTTKEDGRFRFIELEPGSYRVTISLTNFQPQTYNLSELIAGHNRQIEIILLPGIVDAVDIEDAATIDATRTTVGGTITSEELESLPNLNRQALDFVFTLPNVTEEPLSTRDAAEDRAQSARSNAGEPSETPLEAGNFALSGSPAYSNNITIDGLDNNDDRAASERFQPSIDAIAEVQVITNQFAAEYGRASGGRINIRTRPGTNAYRGRGYYFFRDEALNANTYNNNRRGLKRLPLQQHNPGFTLSGALRLPPFGLRDKALYDGKNRTFFFTSYEYDTTLDTALIDTLLPTSSNPFLTLPQPTTLSRRRPEATVSTAVSPPAEVAQYIEFVDTPNTIHRFTTRVDHRFTNNHTSAFLLQAGRAANLRQFSGGSRLAEALLARERNTDALSYTDNFVFSSKIVNQLRAQVSRLTPATIAAGATAPVVLISLRDSLPLTDPDFRGSSAGGAVSLVASNSTSGFASDRRESRFQLQDSLSIVKGNHTIKLGGDIQRITSTYTDLADATGTFNFSSVGDFLANRPSRFRQQFGGESTLKNTYTGFFVQDEWQIKPNFALNYGVRYERESIIRDDNNFSPRIGFALDPTGSGRSVIRGGAGVFYNRALLRTIDDFTLGERQIFFDTNELRDVQTGTALTVAQRQAFIDSNIRFPNALTIDDSIVQAQGVRNTDFARRLDPTLRIPESYQASLGFERDLGGRFAFEANYVFTRGIHLWREFNANAPQLPAGFSDFAAYLQSRDFDNRAVGGVRPLLRTGADTVRFVVAAPNAEITRITEAGRSISLVNLNRVISTNTQNERTAALAAIQALRPDRTRTQLEQLASIGNSRYHGLTFELRRRFARLASNGSGFSVRAGYTLSSLKDDGILNTSEALLPGDFAGEYARSLLDRRHRFVVSGVFDTPDFLGKIRFSPIIRLASGAPFNISAGGLDRNLDDVNNDRPSFNGDLNSLRSRLPGELLDESVLANFALPLIGQVGNLPRNSGTGFGLFIFDLSVTRDFRVSERVRLRPFVEAGNVLNKTVFTFGSEFINFSAATANAETRANFLSSFLVPERTLRQRQIRIGVRFDF